MTVEPQAKTDDFCPLPVVALRGDAVFRRVHRKGKLGRAPLLSLRWLPQRLPAVTVGIVANKKVGGAVMRNRLRRQVREAVRRMDWPKALVMVVLHPEAAGKPYGDLVRSLSIATRRSGLK